MTQNVYIHIPFCKQKCRYCSFISYPDLSVKKQYLQSLAQEIIYFYKKEQLKTLYFGGGTPSLLTPEEFNRLISLFNISPETEVSAELNPENITVDYLKELKAAGINRLSFGCQTFDNKKLTAIGRKHTAQDVINAVNLAFKAGFNNINLDFIYGLPDQTVKDFENDLKKAVTLGIQHISLYGLKIDEGCFFASHRPDNLPDSDIQADMYLKAIEVLTLNGFEHYEISNFSKPDFQSRHNLNYWNNNSYYGFGLAAHGYNAGIRYSNHEGFELYLKNPVSHAYRHKVTFDEKLEEEIFLGFRKTSGISVKKINDGYGINFEQKYGQTIEKYISSGHLEKNGNFYRLTTKGILVSNIILSDFLQ